MRRISDPFKIEHDELQRLAFFAGWVGNLEEASSLLESVYFNIADPEDDDEAPLTSVHEDFANVEEALAIVSTTFEELDQELEGRVTEWLAADPEHWSLFRLIILDPWRTTSGGWRADTPRWVTTLAGNTVIAHFQQDPFGRRRTLDLGYFS